MFCAWEHIYRLNDGRDVAAELVKYLQITGERCRIARNIREFFGFKDRTASIVFASRPFSRRIDYHDVRMAVRQDIFEYIRCVGRLRIIKLGIIKIVDIRIPNRVFNSIIEPLQFL